MKRQSKHWLDSSEDDLILIGEIIGNEHLTHMAAFHAQQAIEKSIKAILEEKESHVPKIHNIITLKGNVEKYIELDLDQDIFDQLNEVYIDSRYPTDLGLLPDGKPSREMAEKFFGMATEIHNAIKAYLSDQPSPNEVKEA
jgi:HEPN domain-containing protein